MICCCDIHTHIPLYQIVPQLDLLIPTTMMMMDHVHLLYFPLFLLDHCLQLIVSQCHSLLLLLILLFYICCTYIYSYILFDVLCFSFISFLSLLVFFLLLNFLILLLLLLSFLLDKILIDSRCKSFPLLFHWFQYIQARCGTVLPVPGSTAVLLLDIFLFISLPVQYLLVNIS